uniref:Ribonuclease Z n=1 Tax=Thuretia quercifolia TaxID=189650 RepID=A0A1Z1MK71_9FLOR|nr:ribonuclease Z [Thuretia quercifolia]ARW66336.1 ribonuclease Z [Thuretia quercifolia]
MKINYLIDSITSLKYSNNSFIVQFFTEKDSYIFNCCEGCQYFIMNGNSSINKISKIIITDLHINNLSGLMGLLSSLNLIGRMRSLHIYGPKDLAYYLDLCKKYSHTNFNYAIYIHILTTGLIINHYQYRIYAFINSSQYDFVIMESEKNGTFFLDKAQKNNLFPGPLYGKLKKGLSFLLPDGLILNGSNFTMINFLGNQLSFFVNRYYRRKALENFLNSDIMFYS